jgi:cell division protein ZapA (FtsZ GTPase activity inhibitor)
MLDKLIEMYGEGSYIVIACRKCVAPEGKLPGLLQMVRQRSAPPDNLTDTQIFHLKTARNNINSNKIKIEEVNKDDVLVTDIISAVEQINKSSIDIIDLLQRANKSDDFKNYFDSYSKASNLYKKSINNFYNGFLNRAKVVEILNLILRLSRDNNINIKKLTNTYKSIGEINKIAKELFTNFINREYIFNNDNFILKKNMVDKKLKELEESIKSLNQPELSFIINNNILDLLKESKTFINSVNNYNEGRNSYFQGNNKFKEADNDFKNPLNLKLGVVEADILPSLPPVSIDNFEWRKKYLKYKSKYILLKNKLNKN